MLACHGMKLYMDNRVYTVTAALSNIVHCIFGSVVARGVAKAESRLSLVWGLWEMVTLTNFSGRLL